MFTFKHRKQKTTTQFSAEFQGESGLFRKMRFAQMGRMKWWKGYRKKKNSFFFFTLLKKLQYLQWGFPGGSDGKESVCNARDSFSGVWSLGGEDPLEKEKATHSSILVWSIPWTEKPGGLQSMGSQRIRHDWAFNTFTFQYLQYNPWISIGGSLHFSIFAIQPMN